MFFKVNTFKRCIAQCYNNKFLVQLNSYYHFLKMRHTFTDIPIIKSCLSWALFCRHTTYNLCLAKIIKKTLKMILFNKTVSNIKTNKFMNLNILAHFDPNLSRITDAARECISLCRTLETFTTYIPPLRSSAFDTKLSMPSHKTERYESNS